jgi:hypothetical protein
MYTQLRAAKAFSSPAVCGIAEAMPLITNLFPTASLLSRCDAESSRCSRIHEILDYQESEDEPTAFCNRSALAPYSWGIWRSGSCKWLFSPSSGKTSHLEVNSKNIATPVDSDAYIGNPENGLFFRLRTATCTNRGRGAVATRAQAQDAAHGLSLWEFRNKVRRNIHGGREIL